MKLSLSLCAFAAAAAFAGSALAAGPTVAFNADVTNDYVFRGLSQTSGKAAAQGGVDVTQDLFYAGAWVSNVDFGPFDNSSLEYDLYAGVRPAFAGLNFDFGVIRYGYTRGPSADNYYEVKALATKTFGPATVGASFFYSPEFFGKTGKAEYYELNAAYTFKNKATLSGAVGYQDLDVNKVGLTGYTTVNVGVTYPVTDKFGIDFRYWGTDNKATNFYGKTFAGDRLAATAKVTF